MDNQKIRLNNAYSKHFSNSPSLKMKPSNSRPVAPCPVLLVRYGTSRGTTSRALGDKVQESDNTVGDEWCLVAPDHRMTTGPADLVA